MTANRAPTVGLQSFAGVPTALQSLLRSLSLGKLNCTLDIELTTGTSTVVNFKQFNRGSFVTFDPTSASAATELASGNMYVTAANRAKGNFTITHAAGAAGRTFRVAVLS